MIVMLHVEKHTLAVSVTRPLTRMCGPVELMVNSRMVIGSVVDNIGVSGIPIVTELSLVCDAVKPTETHIRGFGLLGENGIVGDS